MINLLNSFKWAASGFIFVVRYERNMRIHIVATLYILYLLRFYELTRAEVILLILTCVLVMVLEMLNTAIEVIVDKVSPRYHTLAKIAKDAAAGAVLLASGAAVVVGVLLLWDTAVFNEICDYFSARIINLIILLISTALALIFIYSGKQRKKRRVRKSDD